MKRTFVSMAAMSAALACSSGPTDDDGEDARVICPIGDLTAEPELEMVHRDLAGNMVKTSTRADVPLTLAIQGGQVFYASIRARNIDACSITITATLRDQCNGMVLAVERRPIKLVEDEDGWGIPEKPTEVNNFTSVASCPRVAAIRDIEGEPYEFEIVAQDADGRTGSVSTIVVPYCPKDDLYDFCICECSGDYVNGEECKPDIDPNPPGTCP